MHPYEGKLALLVARVCVCRGLTNWRVLAEKPGTNRPFSFSPRSGVLCCADPPGALRENSVGFLHSAPGDEGFGSISPTRSRNHVTSKAERPKQRSCPHLQLLGPKFLGFWSLGKLEFQLVMRPY